MLGFGQIHIYLVRFKMMLQMLKQAKIDKVYMTRGKICASNIVFHQRSTLSPALAVCTVNKTITQLEGRGAGQDRTLELSTKLCKVSQWLAWGRHIERAFILLKVPSSALTIIKNLQKILKILEAFNKEMALVGAFSGHCETWRRFVDSSTAHTAANTQSQS